MALALSKLEIDISRPEQLPDAFELARKHHCQALVLTPDLVASANVMRSMKSGKFKIYTIIDHPKGDQLGRDKFRGLPTEAMAADGFEILLTARPSVGEMTNEIKYLSKFVRDYFGGAIDLRFVLNLDTPPRTRTQVEAMLHACRHIPMPSIIRTTHLTKVPPAQATANHFADQLKFINEHFACKVKVSGNITLDLYKTVQAERFGVTLQQAQNISRESSIKVETATQGA